MSDRKKIAKLVLTCKDRETLEKVRTLLIGSGKQSKNYVKRYDDEIDEAIKEIESGKFMTVKEAEELLGSYRGIKQKIHEAIDIIDDKDLLKAVHVILTERPKEFELNEDEKRELDAMRKEYKSGKGKNYSISEVREYAYGKLKK